MPRAGEVVVLRCEHPPQGARRSGQPAERGGHLLVRYAYCHYTYLSWFMLQRIARATLSLVLGKVSLP